MKRIEQLRQFLAWFWLVAKPYWFNGQQKWKALGLLLLIVIFIVLETQSSALLNQYQGEFTTALTDKKVQLFHSYLITFGAVLLAYLVFAILEYFLTEKLKLYWRNWLTNHFLDSYFSQQAFYKINGNKYIDNPDQRIAEDIDSFISSSLTYTLSFGSNILTGFLFINILWSINQKLVLVALVTAFLQTLISFLIGRVLTPLNYKNLEYQADFRYSLVHVRDNSESIAFYKGENEERAILTERFDRLLDVINRKILPFSVLNGLNISLTFVVFIVAYLILAPQYFSGQITIGDVTRSVPAFLTVVGVFSWFASYFDNLALFASVIKRLGVFAQFFRDNEGAIYNKETVNRVIEPRFGFSQVTLQTPDHERTLVKDLCLEVPSGDGLLIMGASGSGKSSLLRLIAGLWNSGSGYVYHPPSEEILFLPQRPYMVLGSLRNQIVYPHRGENYSDEHIQSILEKVNLADLTARVGGLDVVLNWADVLSLGEQQRLGFARLLLVNPKYAVLDESTSALDIPNERLVYSILQNSPITYISVGHRPTLVPYHGFVLEILPGANWRIISQQQYSKREK
ncbi:MAG: Vitamin B12 transport ATP-binding protein BacA [Chroococcopsis gigantea SAG 12.99]|jgi:putative ATP-binding cassette transporter|nr:Vitamin B12 transport ATP-binding protein BacA [Chroococcopsis gigantea SAG 12.99]